MLNPRSQLGKQSNGLFTLPADAVAQAGHLEEAIEVVDIGDSFGDGVVVVFRAAKWNKLVVLC